MAAGVIRSLVHKTLGRSGFRLVHAPRESAGKWTDDVGTTVCLPDHLSCDVVVDVGVAGGTPWLYDRFPAAKLILVEPLNVVDALPEMLKGREWQLHECAAGAEPGRVTIDHNVAQPGLSSIKQRTTLTQTDDHLVPTTVEVRTIDDIVNASGFDSNHIGLKIDTEGYEFEVLKGAVATLPACAFVICEASIQKRFHDSYDFSEMVAFMHDRGFSVTAMLDYYVGREGYLRLVDLLFEPR
jgi:FkbM family methyltransferase